MQELDDGAVSACQLFDVVGFVVQSVGAPEVVDDADPFVGQSANGGVVFEPGVSFHFVEGTAEKLRSELQNVVTESISARPNAPHLWYHWGMMKLTREQTEEAVRNPEGVECEGDGTEEVFVIVGADVLRRMKEALYRKDIHESIAAGIADMEAGRMMTAEEADDRVRSECGFLPREAS